MNRRVFAILRCAALMAVSVLMMFVFSTGVHAQDAGTNVTIDGHHTVPVVVQAVINGQSITLTLLLDVHTVAILDDQQPEASVVQVEVTATEHLISGPLTIKTIQIGQVQSLSEPSATSPLENGVSLSSTNTSVPTLTLTVLPDPAPTTLPEPPTTDETGRAVIVKNSANLRDGPGTSYQIAGEAESGELVTVIAQSETGDWYQLEGGLWIAAFLVEDVDASNLPVTVSPIATDGWLRYSMINGAFSFAYPPEWEVTKEGVDDVSISPLNGGDMEGILVNALNLSEDFDDSEETIRLLKTLLLSMPNKSFRFVDQGVLPLPGNPIYLEALGREDGEDVETGYVFVEAPVGEHLAQLVYIRTGSSVDLDGMLPLLSEVAKSVSP